jgi:hypothetical protein
MANPSGEGWEISRQLIDPDLAYMAGLEVLDVLALAPACVMEDPDSNSQVGIYRISNWDPAEQPTDAPNRHDTLYTQQNIYPNLFAVIDIMLDNLPEIHQAVDYGSGAEASINANVFHPGGSFPWHQDVGKPRAAAHLLSPTEVDIADPDDLASLRYSLQVGDVLRLQNTPNTEANTWHRITNPGKVEGVSIVL